MARTRIAYASNNPGALFTKNREAHIGPAEQTNTPMNESPLARLPEPLKGLADLALDLRAYSSDPVGEIWRQLDAQAWERTRNPWAILRNVPRRELHRLAADEGFVAQLNEITESRRAYLQNTGWFDREHAGSKLGTVAYFSMEFALSEALPIYSGGLGILAGDHLKSASDLGVPLVGVGLLYQQGYFRQVLGPDGDQQEAFPFNEPGSLPVTPAEDADGRWPRVEIELPGRTLILRIWEARVGKTRLLLLDSNDPMNAPWDRGITANLYAPGRDKRLLQQIALGIGGCRALELLGIEAEVCHLNEGHAAFAVLARADAFAKQSGLSFEEALWATRAGAIFTTHTPVAAAFDQYDPGLLTPCLASYLESTGISHQQLLALGRRDPNDSGEPFNMAFLAMRGCAQVNGVSRLHAAVSRKLFAPLFPRRPLAEVPVGHVTNGVHIPTWTSEPAGALWREALGDDWMAKLAEAPAALDRVSDERLWEFRARARFALLEYVRRRRARQLRWSGCSDQDVCHASHALDPNALTIGFARRFTEYKRPNLLLHDRERFARILTDTQKPVQLIVAGKAHPDDPQGKDMVREMNRFIREFGLTDQVVFLEDYEMALAKELVGGVDLWINTPRRPAEACGTSGMKVLVNGGLNLSVLDGWWDEAFSPEVGWQAGDGAEHDGAMDGWEAEQIYALLESEIIPDFYNRAANGIPESWIQRIRASMSGLTENFSSRRMVREYVEHSYLPASARIRRRCEEGGSVARQLNVWRRRLEESWHTLHFVDLRVEPEEESGRLQFVADAYLDELGCENIAVELYADATPDGEVASTTQMQRGEPVSGMTKVWRYVAAVETTRPASDFTPRIVPIHSEAVSPLESAGVIWLR